MASPMQPLSPLEPCLDCGTPLHGRFCSRCGQPRQDRDLRLRHVVGEVVAEVFSLDNRILTSLRLLCLRPGQLTLEYFAGRRARFLPPFRLYVFVSFLLFLLLGSGPSAVHAKGKAETNIVINLNEDGERRTPALHEKAGRIKRGINKAKEDPQAFKAALLVWLSRVMFLLLPAFAGLLFLFHPRSGTYFVEHVIFSLHFHTFAFSVFLAQGLLGLVPLGWVRLAGGLLTLAVPVHLCLALKRVHGGPGWKRHLKGIALTAIYLVVVGVALLGVVLWVITRYP